MASAAERQRRSRAHSRGDHSLCLPERACDVTAPADVTPPETSPAVDRPPAGLGPDGRQLWTEVIADGPLGPPERTLLREACRLVDRLDKLDRYLRGERDSWLRVRIDLDGEDLTLTIDKALSEARQQAVALKQILGELRAARTAAGNAPAAPAPAAREGNPDVSGNVVRTFAQRLADKRSATPAG